jgi:hypothetical protein
MNGQKKRWLALIGLSTILLIRLHPVPAANAMVPHTEELAAFSREPILAATVKILMYGSNETAGEETLNEKGQKVRVVGFLERGLGTVVRSGENSFIVTHDHWSLLDDIGRVEIRDPYGNLLVEISGDQFLSLIRLRDGGTLILAMPPTLVPTSPENGRQGNPVLDRPASQTAMLGEREKVAIGDVVLIPNKDDQDSSHLVVEAAVVEDIEIVDGIPVYTFRPLNGGAFVKGDSGGGVFHNGLLIANTYGIQKAVDWRFWTWQELPPAPTPTGVYFAARLPLP